MIQLAFVSIVFVALVYAGVRWQSARDRRSAAATQLRTRIGRRAVVTEAVSAKGGLVRINGEGYAACGENGQDIAPRRLVEVVGLQDLRLVVRAVQGQALLIDVDHIVERERPQGRSESG
jgi:membrane protein implicated in regulation of membrane protease activity